MPDFSGQCRKVPKYAVSMPWTTAPRGIENETGPLRSPDKSRNKGWKMTEEERLRAAHRFERHLQKMDADRLGKFDLMKIDWVAVILIAMAAFCAFYFLTIGA